MMRGRHNNNNNEQYYCDHHYRDKRHHRNHHQSNNSIIFRFELFGNGCGAILLLLLLLLVVSTLTNAPPFVVVVTATATTITNNNNNNKELCCCFVSTTNVVENQRRRKRRNYYLPSTKKTTTAMMTTAFLFSNQNIRRTSPRYCPFTASSSSYDYYNVLDNDHTNLKSFISKTTTTTTSTRIFSEPSSSSSNIDLSLSSSSSTSSSMTRSDLDNDSFSSTATTTTNWIKDNIESENIGPSTIINKNNMTRSTVFKEVQDRNNSSNNNDNKKVGTKRQDIPTTTLPSSYSSSSFPFSLIVGNDLAKKALLLSAANPKGLGSGVLLIGGHGSCKSVLCRSMQQLLLPLSLPTSATPSSQQTTDHNDDTIEKITAEATDVVPQSSTTSPPPPFITVPLHCQEDGLLGTVDLEKSMKEGQAIYEPGLLARAHNGILNIDDIHLLDENLIHVILTAVSDGYVSIEREGISVKYPCRPIVLASYNPMEGGSSSGSGGSGGSGDGSSMDGGDEEQLLRQHWMDRIAMTVPMTDFSSSSSSSTSEQENMMMTIEDRVQVVQNVEYFIDKTMSTQQIDDLMEKENKFCNTIQLARAILPNVVLTKQQLLYLCEESSRADCEGQRGEIYASEIAKTSAALDGRLEVNSKDLQLAVLLSIVPRSRAFTTTTTGGPDEGQHDDEPPPPPPQPQPSSELDQPEQELPPIDEDDSEKQPEDMTPENQDIDYDDLDQENNDQERSEEEEKEELSIPDHFMFGVDAVPLDPQLLNFQQWTRKGNKGGKRSKIFNLKRGRFVKAIMPKDASGWKSGKIAVGATLRAAAPYQKIRRERSLLVNGGSDKPVHIRDVDFRIQRMARKSGSLILFVVDSSGSMALNRMGAAKGAAMSLLNEAYKCRDQICLISFHDKQAEVLVPPTKSMALARNRLEAMPCGGKTPLAHALVMAIRTGMNAVKVKQDVGRVIIVLLADGRANVPLCVSEGEIFDAATMDPDFDGSPSQANCNSFGTLQQQQPSRAFLKEEALALAKQLGSLKEFDLVCVDTEDKFVGAGIAKEVTRAAGGTYFHLTPSTTTAESVANIALQGVRHASQGP